MTLPSQITTPQDPAINELCAHLSERAGALDDRSDWPGEQLRLCAEYGVHRWFLPREWGGFEWSDADVLAGYLRLAAACLTTTFILTQRSGGMQRIVASQNEIAKRRWIPALADGSAMATVGISHLTTSRRHLSRPVLTAKQTDEGFLLEGVSPWVTGAIEADVMVIGATLEDQQQILLALPTELKGVKAIDPPRLVALSASCTGEVRLENVLAPHDCLLAGPDENVMRTGVGAGTGGLQTSTLAVGLTSAAVEFLEHESQKRPDLNQPTSELRRDQLSLERDLLALADGNAVCSNEDLRVRANSLVLRATQAALAAAKGTGFVVGHPAGRWSREALFFLVWSCPQPVLAANLCELAGID